MGAFDKYSNKPDNAPFIGVSFGFGNPVLEVELNEAQQIQHNNMVSLLGIHGDCVINRDGFSYDGTTLTLNTKVVKDGIIIETNGATLALANGESAYISSEIVDYTYQDTIHANGNTAGAVIENTIKDDRLSIECTRRKGYKFTLNKESGMLLGTVADGEFICLAKDYNSGIHRYITDSVSAPSKKGGVKVNRLYGRSVQDGTPTSDAPVEIKSVSSPVVFCSGKNLAVPVEYEDTELNGVTWSINNNHIIASGTPTDQSFSDSIIVFNNKKSKKYTLSLQGTTTNVVTMIAFVNSNDEVIDTLTGNEITFDMADYDYAKYFYIQFNSVETNVAVKCDAYLQLEYGDTKTKYEPYSGSYAQLPYDLNAIPVESGGNVTIDGQQYIADYVDFEKKQLVRCIGEMTIYSVDLCMQNNLGNYVCRVKDTVGISVPINDNTNGNNIICNQLFVKPQVSIYKGEKGIAKLTTEDNLYFSLGDSYTTKSEVDAYLASNPLKLCGILAAPTTIDLTDDEIEAFAQFYSQCPTTNIFAASVDSDQSPILDFDVSTTEIGAKSIENSNKVNIMYKPTPKDDGKRVYGLKKNKNDSNPATRCTYLEDAVGMTPAYMDFTTGKFNYGDWLNAWFVKDNFPCMVKYDGTVDYRLNPDDYTKKEDGTASDVANISYGGNAMSAMPLVWIWQYEEDGFEYIYLANYQVNENYHAYAHQKADGTIRDYIFMSMFKGALDSNNRLRSISGLQPMHSKTADQEIAYAQANGDAWYVKTWAQRNLLICLLQMMFCGTNSQAKLGNGNLNYQSSASPTYGVLKTGTLNQSGQFWGANDTTHQVKAFHQEAVWGDQWDRIAGLINVNGTIKVKMVAPYNLTGTDYVSTGKTPSGTSGGYISATYNSELGLIPITASGSETTYECDGLWFNNTIVAIARVGGDCSLSSLCGFLSLVLADAASSTRWAVGASLSS